MTSKEVAQEYSSSLNDLTVNSKPLITMLTMLAEENLNHAAVIVEVIEKQIRSSPNKLPLMYLIDSILKNVGKDYIKLFAHNIINTFTYVFEKVDEKTRKKLYELRHTWNDVFPKSKLYMLDTKVQLVDPAWPVAASGASSTPPTTKPNIHINPNVIIKSGVVKGSSLSSSQGDKDLKDLEILKQEQKILELKKQRYLLEQKKNTIEQSRQQQKTEAKAVKPDPVKPVVSSTIHVDPRRAHMVLPQVAASVPSTSRDPRTEASSRDPRIKSEKSRDPRLLTEASRDPRIKPDVSSRDPRLNVADPVATSVSAPSKIVEAQAPVPTSRDPRILNKNAESKMEPAKIKKEKESPSKRKKSQRSEKSEKVETRSSRETRSSKSTSREKEIAPKIPKPAEVPETSTSFNRPKNNKRRNYMAKEESSEEKGSSQGSGGKRSRTDRSQGSEDSEDSDHYVGNVPNPSLYRPSSKKAKKHDVGSSPVVSDTDYRHFTPSKRLTATANENLSPPPKKDKLMEEEKSEPPQGLGLFSDKDVDYRQLLPRPMHVPGIPTAIPNILPAVSQSFSSKDLDERNPGNRDANTRDPLACLNPPDNQDIGAEHTKGDMAPPDMLHTPMRNADCRMRKPSFNSPHAASWEKFREKNPEFKEYTRQASISESERNFPLDGDESDMTMENQHGFPVHIKDISIPGPYEKRRHRSFEDEEGSESPRSVEVAPEKYNVILAQAEEQRKRGEINMSQYNHLLGTIVTLMEKAKIQRVKDQDRQMARTPQPQITGSDDDMPPNHANDRLASSLPLGGPERPSAGNVITGSSGLPIGRSDIPGGPLDIAPGGHPGSSFTRQPGTHLSGHPGGVHSRPPGGPPPGPHAGLSPGHRGPGSPGSLGRGLPNSDGSGQGGRGGFNRGDGPMGRRGGMIGRGGVNGRLGPGPEGDEGWGRGGRGRGRRGMGGFGRENLGGRGTHCEPLEDEWTGDPELPALPEEYLQAIDRENVTRKIEIDGMKRDVRTYGQTAVVFMNWDDPRALSFGEGQVTIVFDGGQFRMPARIGQDNQSFTFEGKTHRIRLGPPSEELIIDNVGYHCLIGGDPITVHFDGAPHTIRLEGKVPNVNISPTRNTEYVAGVIRLVIQAKKLVPLFLDAKPQRFNIDGRVFVLKFVDSLRAVTINNVKFPVKFGGLPLSITVRGYRRFLSFSELPHGIIPGQVSIQGMEGERPSLPRGKDTSVDVPAVHPPQDIPPSNKPLVVPSSISGGPQPQVPIPPGSGPPQSSNMPRPVLQGPPQPPALKGPPLQGSPIHDPVFGVPPQGSPVLTSVPGPRPPVPGSSQSETPVLDSKPPVLQPQDLAVVSAPSVPPPSVPPTSVPPPPIPGAMVMRPMFPFIHHPPPPIGAIAHPSALGSYTSNQLPLPNVSNPPSVPPPMPLDINSLLVNLTRTGLIGNKVRNKEEEKKLEEEEEEKEREAEDRLPIELLLRSENLRKRKKWLIESLYRGMQCSSCGLRYPPEQTVQYSHHLDWHFRINKKQQESTKKANTRRFYFSFEDWLQYEEIEDLEERVPSMFETEGAEETMDSEESEVPSVPASNDPDLQVCPTCLDKFQQFYHQETEEWRYLNAIQVDGLNYHPSCHQDNLRAEEAARKEAEKEETEVKEGEKDDVSKEESEKEVQAKETTSEKMDDDVEEGGGTKLDADTQNFEEQSHQDVPMESQGSVTAKLDGMSLDSQVLVQIKEEPMDVEDTDSCSISFSLPAGITIKQEVKKEPEEQDEEELSTRVPEEEDETSLLNSEANENDQEWSTPTVAVNAAETDIASTIDGNTELSTPDTNKTAAPKIVFNVSKPAVVNNVESNNNASKNHDVNSNSVGEKEDEFTPPPFTVDYELKPAFRNVKLVEQPLAARGIELSGLCSIM